MYEDVRPDILDRLRADWCRYDSPMYAEAANEIERLRRQVEEAHDILGSDHMVWLFTSAINKQNHINRLKVKLQKYWSTYGNKLRSRNEAQNSPYLKPVLSDTYTQRSEQ